MAISLHLTRSCLTVLNNDSDTLVRYALSVFLDVILKWIDLSMHCIVLNDVMSDIFIDAEIILG